MARRQDGNPVPSEAVQIEKILSSLKHKKKRKIADVDVDADSNDSRDRNAFFHRVQTFSIITWFGKPLALSPIQCAKYGWVNIESDILQCRVCRAVICATLPVNFDPKVYQACVKKLSEKLKNGHEQACKWRSNPTPDSLILVPTHDKAEVIEEYKGRLQGLLSLGDRLPYLCIGSIESQGILDPTLNALAEYCLESTHNRETVDLDLMKRASIMSLCGWKISSDDAEDIMTCEFCQRSVGLWNYKSPHWHQTKKVGDCDVLPDSENTEREEADAESNQSTERVQGDDVECESDGNGHVNPDVHQIVDCVQEESANVNDTENGAQENGSIVNNESDSGRRNGDETQNNTVTHFDVMENVSKKDSKLIESDNDVNGAKESKDIEECITERNGVDTTDSLSKSQVEEKVSNTDHEKEKNGDQTEINKSDTDDRCMNGNKPNHDEDLSVVKSNGHCVEEVKERGPSELTGEVSEELKEKGPSELTGEVSEELKEKGPSEQTGEVSEEVKEKGPSELTGEVSDHVQGSSCVSRTNSTEGTPAKEHTRKRIKLEEKDSFDPLAEHRTWCSWLQKSYETSPWKQLGSEAVAPWKKILYMVCPSLKDSSSDPMSLSSQYKQVSPVAALGRVRRILHDWTGENFKD